jgi:preprotein translocase subunit YajC
VTAEEWTRILLAMGILAAMFGFPIVMIWRDERRKRQRNAEVREESSATRD